MRPLFSARQPYRLSFRQVIQSLNRIEIGLSENASEILNL